VVPVGGLAIKRALGISGLAGCIGSKFELGDAIAVPLPHPSGASGWLNSLENRKRLEEALALLRAEL
jgi:uracil-DNA glycosylase